MPSPSERESSDAAPPSGRIVAGRYRLRRKLGQGSMGAVWEAYDEFLRRPVAVKEVLLPPGIPQAEADELRERTLREARAIAALSHPNVITLHDVVREHGEPFVVTEYMPAHSLAQLVRTLGPLTGARAAAIGEAVAAGLSAAHQAGITHRDVKPGNVLVGGHGQVKLTDFGIARNVSERTMTKTGIMLGSPAYIAPEVAAGREVTPAADLWGLGATLFAVVEGHAPYDVNAAVLETVNTVVHGEVPRPASAGPLAELITALMVKDPTRRISLAEVRNRLHPLLPPPSTPLLSEADLARLAEPVDEPVDVPEPETGEPATEEPATGDVEQPAVPPPAPPVPPPVPAAPGQLAPAPGPLPFDATVRQRVRRRGALAATVLAIVSVLLFAAAAGGGFALARVVGGEEVRPPERTPTATSSKVPEAPLGELEVQTGDAATIAGAQGGGYSVPVPRGWVKFVEQRVGESLPDSTKVFFVSPNGTQMLTVERMRNFYPDRTIEDYLDELASYEPNVTYEQVDRAELPDGTGAEPATQLTYRTSISAENVVPDDPAARNLNRVTFANLLPQRYDLWVVSVTVPIEQEDSGRDELFDKIVPRFELTG